MKSLILWLSHRRLINILLLVSYFLLVVLPHEQVGRLTVAIFGHLSRDTYNLIILLLGSLSFGLFLIPFLKRIKRHPEKKIISIYLLITIGLIILALNTLFVINIEIVHFFQYAGMTLLLFSLTFRYGETLFWATLLGAIDEGYQYFYLSPERTDYYDFNDVIINLLGAAMMLIFIKTYSFAEVKIRSVKWYQSSVLYTSLVIVLGVAGLYFSGYLGIYPQGSEVQPPILLVKVLPESFWSVVHPQVTYHVVLPLEGVILTSILLIFYSVGLSNTRLFQNK
ncbi:MAG: hypothetical protein AB8G22_11115 [Saprospiraceae bacterium]